MVALLSDLVPEPCHGATWLQRESLVRGPEQEARNPGLCPDRESNLGLLAPRPMLKR